MKRGPTAAARRALYLIGAYLVLAALFVKRHRWRYLGAAVVVGCIAAVSVHYDAAMIATVQEGTTPAVHQWADFLSDLGKTDAMTLYVVLFFAVLGGLMRRPRVGRVSLLILLALLVSGVGVNVLRPAFGRARPFSERAGEFTFFSADHEFNSFPSGHSSEAWAVGSVVVAAYPPLAIPVGIYAGQMLWARMEVNRHFPTDVLAGAAWGLMCGLPFAYFARHDIRPRCGRRKRVRQSAESSDQRPLR